MKQMTENRAKLLRLFFTNPDNSFYMQEIGKLLKKKPGVFQRTLNNMVSEGILRSEYRANARYFSVNRDYPLYDELKSIIFKTVGIQGSIKEILHKVGGVKNAFIYGSYAKSKENSLSDVDLVIIGSPNEDKLVKELDMLEEQLKREINYKLFSLRELKKEVEEKEPFIAEVLKDKKIIVIGSVSSTG